MSQRPPTDRSRLEQAAANSWDWRAILVYADLLEEEGDTSGAEAVRLRVFTPRMLEQVCSSLGVPAALMEDRR